MAVWWGYSHARELEVHVKCTQDAHVVGKKRTQDAHEANKKKECYIHTRLSFIQLDGW